jgi:hypothetical protein
MSDPKDFTEENTEAEVSEKIQEEAAGPTDEEWERRILCSDETCIGVIGPDGRCKECGKPYEGKLPGPQPTDNPPSFSAAAREAEEKKDNAVSAEADLPSSSEDPSDPEDEWKNRKLCSDGNCIGVIGPDGRCKECGKPYEGK